jgi:hypothetical protein
MTKGRPAGEHRRGACAKGARRDPAIETATLETTMHKTLATISLALLGGASFPASAADIELRVILSGEVAPGVYGRVDIGTAPPPPLLYAKPVIIVRQPGPPPGPIYLHVPPGHAKHWSKHCHQYNACGRPVYFVKSQEYAPGYKPKKGK